MRTETFETPGALKLELSVPAGSIELETAEGGMTQVHVDGPHEDEYRLELIERDDRAVLTVAAPHKRFGFSGSDHRVAISAPPGAEVEVKGGSTDVQARGRYGSVEVQTGSGDLEVDAAATLSVKCGSGDVNAREIDGSVTAVTGSGDIEIGRLGGGGSFRSGSGDVQIGESDGDVSIVTASGDQSIGSVGSGRLKLRAASGDVQVGIRRGSRVFVDARSASGDMDSELDLAGDAPPGDGPMVDLDAATASGAVRIIRTAT